MRDVFDDSNDYFTGPTLTMDAVKGAEVSLGYKIPAAYVALLLQRIGGVPSKRCLRTTFPTSWARDHLSIDGILGLGGTWGIDTARGSRCMIAEWGYPDLGLVICATPSAGHDTVTLDYSSCGTDGEPAVVYIDEDRQPRTIAPDFATFLAKLEPCDRFTRDV